MIDQQAAHEAFEQLVGGPARGFRLMRLHTAASAAASGNRFMLDPYQQVDPLVLFRRQARAAGYTDEQIDAFLALP